MAHEHGNGNGGPWWAKFTERVGIAAMFAAVLLWFLLGNVEAKIDELLGLSRVQERYLRQICVNTSNTEAERTNCR